MRRWLMILIAVLPMLALATTPANAAPAQTAVETPIGHLGDTLRIHDGDVIAIGSGGTIAQAAAEALCAHTDMDAESIAKAAMGIASKTCIYTNSTVRMEQLP